MLTENELALETSFLKIEQRLIESVTLSNKTSFEKN